MKQMTTIGHLGQDAVIQDSNGKKSLRTTLAVYEAFTNTKGEKIERTTWFTIFYRGIALAPYLKKGAKIFAQGEHSVNLYKDNSGQHQIGQTINADNILLLDKKSNDAAAPAPVGAPADLAYRQEDDMPF